MEVQQIKDVVAPLLKLHMAYDKAMVDGKLGVEDIAFLVEPLIGLPAAISGAEAAVEQLKVLTEEGRKDVLDWAKASYDIADDELELKVESGLGLVLELAKFLGVIGVISPAPVEGAPVEPPPAA